MLIAFLLVSHHIPAPRSHHARSGHTDLAKSTVSRPCPSEPRSVHRAKRPLPQAGSTAPVPVLVCRVCEFCVSEIPLFYM